MADPACNASQDIGRCVSEMPVPGRPQTPPGSLNEASEVQDSQPSAWPLFRVPGPGPRQRARACVRAWARVRGAAVCGLAGYFASGRGCARSCLPPLSPTPFPGPSLSFGKMSDTAVADTRRLNSKPQDLTDAYGPPSNFLEIDIFNPQTVGVGRARFTTYEVRMRVSHGVRETAEGGPGGWAGAARRRSKGSFGGWGQRSPDSVVALGYRKV